MENSMWKCQISIEIGQIDMNREQIGHNNLNSRASMVVGEEISNLGHFWKIQNFEEFGKIMKFG
jgi:hypothetical protein